MAESFVDLVDFAYRQISVRNTGEPVTFDEYRAAAQHVNGILSEWSEDHLVTTGFSRKAFRVAAEQGVFSIGPGLDFPTSTPVSRITAIQIRGRETGQYRQIRMSATDTLPSYTSYSGHGFYDEGARHFAVSYDRDHPRILFPVELVVGDVVVVDYQTELGVVDLPRYTDAGEPDGDDLADRVLNIRFDFPNRYLNALRYALAERLGMENQTDPETIENMVTMKDRALGQIRRKHEQPSIRRHDSGLVRGMRRYYVNFSEAERTDIGGVYQEDLGVVLEETHPSHPDYSDGTLPYGYIAADGSRTEQGRADFRYDHAAAIQFAAVPAGGGYLYVTIPDGARVSSMLDSRGHDQVSAWMLDGRDFRVGPVSAEAASDTPSYSMTIVRS